MAVRRSPAASLSTTLGIAAATMVVAGGIMAWPTLSRCSADAGDLGACLRDALVERGLLSPGDPVAPPLPVAPSGWLDARANEVAPPSLPAIELSEKGGWLRADEIARANTPADAPQIALAPAAPLIPAPTPAPPAPVPPAVLSPTPGLDVIASAPPDAPETPVALIGPAGVITAAAPIPSPADAGTAQLQPSPPGILSATAPAAAAPLPSATLAPLPAPLGTAVAPVLPEPIPVELTAEAAPVPEPPAPEPTPVLPEPEPEPAPIVPAPPPGPEPVIAFNPAFPNVIVLPPPATGANSSVLTWTID